VRLGATPGTHPRGRHTSPPSGDATCKLATSALRLLPEGRVIRVQGDPPTAVATDFLSPTVTRRPVVVWLASKHARIQHMCADAAQSTSHDLEMSSLSVALPTRQMTSSLLLQSSAALAATVSLLCLLAMSTGQS